MGGFQVLSEESCSVGSCVSGSEEGVLPSGEQAGRMETGREKSQTRTWIFQEPSSHSWRGKGFRSCIHREGGHHGPSTHDFRPLQVPIRVSEQSLRQSGLESPGLTLEAKQVVGHLSPQNLERDRSKQ